MGTYETNNHAQSLAGQTHQVEPQHLGARPQPIAAQGSGGVQSIARPAIRLTPIRFGEFLCQKELITEEQLLEALGDHWSNGGKIGSAVALQGFLDPEEIERQAAAYHSLETVEV